MAIELLTREAEPPKVTIEMPTPTAWPIVLAFGLTLLAASLLTSEALGVLGAIVAVAGAAGWFRDVLPEEHHESISVETSVPIVTTSRAEVATFETGHGLGRAWLPVETYPLSAGMRGGLAGGVAMALIAMLYGVFSGNGIWYPINLLAAGFFPKAATYTTAKIAEFHLRAFLIAIPIHLLTSLLVGLLYGAMLPMSPRRPILLGGLFAPLLWSGLLYSTLDTINPVLNQRIDWFWFVLSQVGFGIVAGLVVSRVDRIRTQQQVPLAARLGLEVSGMDTPGSEEKR